MTFFQIADEYERDFEELEERYFEGCAYATLLYVQMGHKCASRMTDGRISRAMLAKRCATWPKERLEAAIADLIDAGQWRATETGYEFVDWDSTQFTREQEEKRRANQRERQRRRRARLAEEEAASRVTAPSVTPRVTHDSGVFKISRHENIAESENVTRDVTPPSASPLGSSSVLSSKDQKGRQLALVPDPTPQEPEPRGKKPPLAKAGRKRARTQLDDDRDRMVAIFNETFARKRGKGLPWKYGPRHYGLLNRVVQHYTRADGVFDAHTFDQVVYAWAYNNDLQNYGGWHPEAFFGKQHMNALTKMQGTGTYQAYEHDY